MNRLSELLKGLRKSKGYSLRQVERLSKSLITHGYLHTLEKGHTHNGKPVMPSPRIVQILAEVYEYPYEDMLRAAGYLSSVVEKKEPLRLEEIFQNNNIVLDSNLLDEQDKEDLLLILRTIHKALRQRNR